MRLGVDPSYLEYAQCACVEGMEVQSKPQRSDFVHPGYYRMGVLR